MGDLSPQSPLLLSIGHVSEAYVLAIMTSRSNNLNLECRMPCWKARRRSESVRVFDIDFDSGRSSHYI
jgi:hypothetical protein